MWNIPPQGNDMYGAPPPGYGGPPPGMYGAPPPGNYGAPPPVDFGVPPMGGGFNGPPPGAYGAPPPGAYGAPPPGGYASGYGGPPPGAYGAPPPGAFGAPPPGAYGAPPPGAYGGPPPGAYGAPPPGAYGAPPPGAYGAPPPGAYGAPPPGAYNGDPMFAPPGTYGGGMAANAAPIGVKAGGQKRAVLIGINYSRHARGQLKGCINDVHTIQAFLQKYGFNNVRVLTDDQQDPSKQPTKDNIMRDIRWLTAGTQPGDSLFFHYSGHGGQVKDVSGDEEDGLDETILPVDYDKNGQIIDDILHDILVKPLPPGSKLTALMDCCHSGTGLDLPYVHTLTGGSSYSGGHSASGGGSSGITMSSKIKKKAKKKIMSTLTQALMGPQQHGGGAAAGGVANCGDCFLYSGCRDDQTSADTSFGGKAQGAMTYAFTQALLKNPHQSYYDVLRSMRDLLQAARFTQVPQLSTQRQVDLNQAFSL